MDNNINMKINMIEKISRRVFGIATILLAGGLTLSIVSSANLAFADKATSPNEDVNATVSLLVNPSITLKIIIDNDDVDPNPAAGESNSMLVELSANQQSAGRFSAIVTTNRDYILQLNGLDGDTAMSHESDGTYFIPGTGCTVAAGTNCWGIVSWSSDYTNPPAPTTYQSIPAVATELARNTGPVSEDETRFEVGISTSADITAGTYKGKLVVTASNI